VLNQIIARQLQSSMYFFKHVLFFALLEIHQKSNSQFQKGKILQNPFAVFDGPYGIKQCIKECLLQRRCQAMGYYHEHLKCALGYTREFVNASDHRFTTAISLNLMEYQVCIVDSTLTKRLLDHGCFKTCLKQTLKKFFIVISKYTSSSI